MTEFISNMIGNDLLATLIMSLVPLIELKGSIVFARGIGYGFFKALGISYVGSTFAFIPVFFLLIPILNLIKKIKPIKGIADKIEGYFENRASDTLKKQEGGRINKSPKLLKQIGVFIFVAIPLPMTGVWTGTAIAVFLGMKFKEAVLPIALGNLVAGVLISVLAEVCMAVWSIVVLDYILWALLGLAVILLIITIIKISRSGKKTETKIEE